MTTNYFPAANSGMGAVLTERLYALTLLYSLRMII